MKPPIVICTIGNPGVAVLESSIFAYAPGHEYHLFEEERSTFGEAYNRAMDKVFKDHDEIIISNDDVVLTPDTLPVLMEDVTLLKERHGDKLGVVATFTDNARASQDVKFSKIERKQQDRVSPIFAWISKKAFDVARFPPLNWYSDDVLCEDLIGQGFKNYVSRAYVHHAGSQTVGIDYQKLNAEAMPWLQENRPNYLKKWFNL